MRPPLRILFDASLAQNPAGTGTFVRGLRSGLAALPGIEIVESRFDSGSATVDTGTKSAPARVRNSLRHLWYYRQTLPGRARQMHCDVIFCPSSLVPLRGRTPFLMTVFDLTPLRFAGTQDWLSRQYIAGMMRAGVRRAAAICTISQAVGDEITSSFRQVPPIHVTYPGPNPELLQAEPIPAPIPGRPFLLMVGTLEPRKNHLTALRALAEHRRRHPESALILVLAGSAGWRYGPVVQAIDELTLTDRVIRLGPTSPGALAWLYRNAAALLFPSLYEGFGLPVLEALALECPVVASRLPSVFEITGDTATLLEPMNVTAWTSAIDGLLEPRRDRAALEAGRRRAGRFTWEACGAAALTAVEAALERPA